MSEQDDEPEASFPYHVNYNIRILKTILNTRATCAVSRFCTCERSWDTCPLQRVLCQVSVHVKGLGTRVLCNVCCVTFLYM